MRLVRYVCEIRTGHHFLSFIGMIIPSSEQKHFLLSEAYFHP
jgi:hypothetical protein